MMTSTRLPGGVHHFSLNEPFATYIFAEDGIRGKSIIRTIDQKKMRLKATPGSKLARVREKRERRDKFERKEHHPVDDVNL
eukprot:CAMPEP_0184495816 /NCGR_PEP_ID=MMETSP0113_2-20130426/32437_1 /TAXON_ID=91329 /ORGANISM="Norrisiella sphaerica, Strain BC52" /LENGTH=80 /DNA_ID=CAMNT_0026882179 /DNA_START=153 /DNA_END=395 /DNA_ORIENTATION=-